MPHYPQCCAVSRPCKEYITLTFIFYNIAARRDDCKFFETHNQEIHEAHKHSQQKQFSPGTVQLRDQLGEAEQRAHGAQQGVQQHRHRPGHRNLVPRYLFTLFSDSIFINFSREYLMFHSPVLRAPSAGPRWWRETRRAASDGRQCPGAGTRWQWAPCYLKREN